jgi:hypothetical protein
MHDPTLQALIGKINLFLDNGLSEAEESELLRQIQANPAYLQILSREQSFREFIKTRIHRRKPSPVLIQSIKEKIKAAPGMNGPQ